LTSHAITRMLSRIRVGSGWTDQGCVMPSSNFRTLVESGAVYTAFRDRQNSLKYWFWTILIAIPQSTRNVASFAREFRAQKSSQASVYSTTDPSHILLDLNFAPAMVAVTRLAERLSSPPLAPSFCPDTSFRALSSLCLWLRSGWQWSSICSYAREATKCRDFHKLPFVPPLPLQILPPNETVSTVAIPIATLFTSSTMTSE
jgi:hypothetical protein